MTASGTWLCPTAFDRDRLIDMEAKLAPARAVMFGCIGVGLLSGIPWFGWWIVVLLAWVVLFYRLLAPWIARSDRPEYPIALSAVHAQVMIGIAVALTGGPRSPALPLLLLAVLLMPARFTAPGVIAGVGLTVVVILASTVGVDPSGYAHDPMYVNATLATLGGLTGIAYVLMRSEHQQRSDAILDPLTGLLNRKALMDRFGEIAGQAALTGGWVSLIACDLDRFKAINDEYGHDRGDAVLKEAAYVIRRNLRSFELVYRMGGEEFLIVVPGATLEAAQLLAERARLAIEEARPGGLAVTVSMGVAAAEASDVVFESLFRDADEALYRAKREGRNRVVAFGAEPAPLAVVS